MGDGVSWIREVMVQVLRCVIGGVVAVDVDPAINRQSAVPDPELVLVVC